MDVKRCPWVNLNNPLYITYHDKEWGEPVYDDRMLFELLILEGAQAGLSWETILKKRAHYQRCFANFDPEKVSKFTAKKVEKLLQDPGIVRNRLKIESTIQNAIAFIKIQKTYGSFADYLWAFVDHKPIVSSPRNLADYPAKTALSDEISKSLKKQGFKFVGSTIVYAYMQAVGLVNEHSIDCFKKKQNGWSLYMVRTGSGSLYTGIAKNVSGRFAEHQAQGKKCAKYLRGKSPLSLVYSEYVGSHGEALRREAAVKRLSKVQKEALIL